MRKFATNLLFCTSIIFTDVWNIQNIWKQNRLHISWNSWILNGKDKNRKSYLHSKSLCIRLDRGFYLNLALYIVCLFVFYSFFFFFDVTQIMVIHELVCCHAGPFLWLWKLHIHIPSDSQLRVNAELVPSLELFQSDLRGRCYKLDLIT